MNGADVVRPRFDHLWDAREGEPGPVASGVVVAGEGESLAESPRIGTITMLPPIVDDETDAPEPGGASKPIYAPAPTGAPVLTEAPARTEAPGGDDATVRIRPARVRAAEAAMLEVELSTGERVPLDAPVVIGRAPQATPGVRLLTSPGHLVDLSRSHVAVEAVAEGVIVRDLGSGNGSVLLRDGKRLELAPHTPTMMIEGDTLVLADVLGVRIGRRA